MDRLFEDIKKIHPWMVGYAVRVIARKLALTPSLPRHIFFCICDHFEPLRAGADRDTGLERVRKWVESYPAIVDRHVYRDGSRPLHTFFYPAEEYVPLYLNMLAGLCRRGCGEVEIHLHHDRDTPDNLRNTLVRFRDILADEHALLSTDRVTGSTVYGFIHGNWALDNSRPDGMNCGVNNELDILQDTGCYADFTMPSAPDPTQTSKINSIYYAVDDPQKPKSHDRGNDAAKGVDRRRGLLCLQGPLMMDWRRRKLGIFPRIENSNLGGGDPVTEHRIRLWADAHVHVKNKPEYGFIKVHTHGCWEKNSDYLLGEGLDRLFSLLEEWERREDVGIHIVSARQMINVVKALEQGIDNIDKAKEYRYVMNWRSIND